MRFMLCAFVWVHNIFRFDVAELTMTMFCRTTIDMQMVKDKITLCREMLPETAGVDRDAAFSEVVGFLEVCAVAVTNDKMCAG